MDKRRWILRNCIGKGSFGKVFAAVQQAEDDTRRYAAVKIEDRALGKNILKVEVAIIRRLQGNPTIPVLYAGGRNHKQNFVIMELLGASLSQLRKCRPGRRFNVATCLEFAQHMLEGIVTMHRKGFLHRDVKPGNFLVPMNIEQEGEPVVKIIDFGLSRRILLDTGTLRRPRDRAPFRGTVRYAAINAHLRREQSYGDDMWSWLFSIVEMMSGTLPWTGTNKAAEVLDIKREALRTCKFLQGLPVQLEEISKLLTGLDYGAAPDYARIRLLIAEARAADGGASEDLMDLARESEEKALTYQRSDEDLKIAERARLSQPAVSSPLVPGRRLETEDALESKVGPAARSSMAERSATQQPGTCSSEDSTPALFGSDILRSSNLGPVFEKLDR